MNTDQILEFDTIKQQLAEHALSDAAKQRCIALTPSLREQEARRNLEETTQAKKIIEGTGTPPLTAMADLEKLITLLEAGDMLLPEQLEQFLLFAKNCARMKAYLRRAESSGTEIAFYGNSLLDLSALAEELERCIRSGRVDDHASGALSSIRRQMENTSEQIKSKLNSILTRNKNWFSDSFVSVRGEHYTLPLKREYKNELPGTVIETSNTGSTLFVEPASVTKLQQQISLLLVDEDCEIRRILYTLTALIADCLYEIRRNMEALEILDFQFAKAKLSLSMKASPVNLTTERMISIHEARHPLLDAETAVPLDFSLGNGTSGVVITGPNTGGKTVALKTVGLLSLMGQSGLHVPASAESVFTMHSAVLCDIGDGQSISANLSTFSSHIKNIIEILRAADSESLVLLDEVGSGTDPAEGMGLAVAILEELCQKNCLFLATTHYPEVKDFAAERVGLQNARMAFDRQSLQPLYRLEIGEAGESCALHIAERLGMAEHILHNAAHAAYSTEKAVGKLSLPLALPVVPQTRTKIVKQTEKKETSNPAERFQLGDSVIVYPQKEIGIVCAVANEMGEIGVQIKKVKKRISHKHLKLHVAAEELYPEDYDFSVIFDTVANRKARHRMEKRHETGNVAVIEELE